MSIVSSISGIFHHTTAQPVSSVTAVTPSTSAQSTSSNAPKMSADTLSTSSASGGGLMSSLNFHDASLSSWVSRAGTWGNLANKAAVGFQGGAAVAPNISSIISAGKSFDLNGVFGGLKSIGSSALPFAKRSALIEGGLSVLTNGYALFKGQISLSTFGGRVTGDTMGGLAGGVGGAIASGVGIGLLGVLGVTGGLATVGGVVAGIVGYSLAEKWFRHTRIFQKAVSLVQGSL
jgi:hypothetical protein